MDFNLLRKSSSPRVSAKIERVSEGGGIFLEMVAFELRDGLGSLFSGLIFSLTHLVSS